jgi:hypothetical protein
MKTVFSAIMVFSLLLSWGVVTAQTTEIAGQITVISGKLKHVSVEKQEIYIINDTRIIKFKADKELCDKFKDDINAIVIIHYVKKKDGALYITAMQIFT